MTKHNVSSMLSRLLFPPKCILCGELLTTDEDMPFCLQCEKKAVFIVGKRCKACGRGVSYCVCGGEKRSFDAAASAMYYTEPLSGVLLNLKKHEQGHRILYLSDIAANAAREAYPDMDFDLLLCVPSSKQSIHDAGFDRMSLFGRKLSHMLGLKYERRALLKIRDTKKQHTLTGKERYTAQKGAFFADARIVAQKRILLFDDVITTGSTLDECAAALKQAGAAYVCCLTVAATRFKRHASAQSALQHTAGKV